VRLPIIALDSRLREQGQHRAKDQFVFPAESLTGLPVMVVDDDAGVRDVVAFTLTKCGAFVTVSDSAQQALELLTDVTPAIVVSDLAMPDVDGYEFVRRFHALMAAKGVTVPVIALTAYGSVEDRDRALEAGFDRYLAKPIDPAELVRMIVKTRAEKLQLVG
jgi:CheY-like chemotaxis protein